MYDDLSLVYFKYFHFRIGMYDILFSWISNLFLFPKQREIFYTHQCVYCLVLNLQTLWQPECYYREHI